MAKGRVEFDFTPTADLECAARGAAYCGDNGIWIVLRATNPANPLRNLRRGWAVAFSCAPDWCRGVTTPSALQHRN